MVALLCESDHGTSAEGQISALKIELHRSGYLKYPAFTDSPVIVTLCPSKAETVLSTLSTSHVFETSISSFPSKLDVFCTLSGCGKSGQSWRSGC